MRVFNFFICVVSTLFLLTDQCESYKILGIVGWPSFSHQRAFTNLWRELSLKGHVVTIITTDPLREPGLVNLTEIDISEGHTFLEEKYDWSRYLVKSGSGNPMTFIKNMLDLRTCLAEYYFKLPQIQALIHDKSQQFDVVLTEALFTHFLIFGEVFNAPTISISSFDPTALTHNAVGNPWNPVVYPSVMFPFPKPYGFVDRVISTVMTNFMFYLVSDMSDVDQMIARNFPNDTETMEKMLSKVSFHFTAVNPLLLTPRPHSARYVVIGGNERMVELQPLSKDVLKFLDSAHDGFVYFSLGSNVKAELLGENFVRSIAKVLGQLPYKVLWKTMDTNINVAPNTKLVKWVPQRYVLTHPNIKVFVTQGGIQSIEEAVLSKIPMVGIPIFADQKYNVFEIGKLGFLKRVSHEESNFEANLKAAILDVGRSKQYRKNIERFKELSQEQMVPGIEKAIWHIEYTIRHRGNLLHLENTDAKNVLWYQYYLLDVLLFLFSILLGVLFILCKILNLVKWLFLAIVLYGRRSHDKTE